MNKYIFLDFDGVLNINGKKTFYRSQHFADCIVELDNLFVVFSTSWREYAPLERLVNLMPKKIQHKCVGKTPLINDDIKHVRYHEILSYTNENNISDNQWVAIDDMDCLFPKDCKNLILTNPSIGFFRQEAKKIRDFYENNFF